MNTTTIPNIHDFTMVFQENNLVLTRIQPDIIPYYTIPNIHDFTMVFQENDLVLTRIQPVIIQPVIDQATLQQTIITGSRIVSCRINNNLINSTTYRGLLVRALTIRNIRNVETIKEITNLNIVAGAHTNIGFKPCPGLGFSMQGANARKTLNAIINIIQNANFSFDITLRLATGQIIRFII
jgi:hypothetical protein